MGPNGVSLVVTRAHKGVECLKSTR